MAALANITTGPASRAPPARMTAALCGCDALERGRGERTDGAVWLEVGAAGGVDLLPGDPACFVGGKETHDACDIVGLAHATQGAAGSYPGLGFFVSSDREAFQFQGNGTGKIEPSRSQSPAISLVPGRSMRSGWLISR